MPLYIYQRSEWPHFTWDADLLSPILANVKNKQERLHGSMQALGFKLRNETVLEALTLDVLKSSEIEGELLNPEQVRSSIARRLGMDIAGLVPSDRNVDGVVQMMMDATQNYSDPLSKERLFVWHANLFPTRKSGAYSIVVGTWRSPENDPMQVVSGPMGREKVHYQAPEANKLEHEMALFFNWFNTHQAIPPLIKAAIAHLWFVTIHPFEDGNGRIARAISDIQLTRADGNHQRFYSMSAQIRIERKSYYEVLEKTQKGALDITPWLEWFLTCLQNALTATELTLENVLTKTRFWSDHSTISLNERQNLMLNKWLDGFTGKLTSSKWAKIAKCSPDTALRDIQDLLNKDILQKEQAGGRSTSYTVII